MSEVIKACRQIMREAFERDPDFKRAYIANIAMLIYDDQGRNEEENISRRAVGLDPHYPTGVTTIGGCNDMAERILDLIFRDYDL
jgi:hypothetical protein